MKIENSVVLITGANRGIGLAFARALLARGARKVYATARDPATVTLPGVQALRLDVTRPEDIAAAAPPPFSIKGELKELGSVAGTLFGKGPVLHMVLGVTIASFGSYGSGQFVPPYFTRNFGLNYAEVGLITGIVGGISSGIGTLVGGFLTDRLSKRSAAWYSLTPAIGLSIATPIYIAAYLQPSWQTAALILLVPGIFHYTYLGPTFGVVQNMVELRRRATATALLFFFLNLIALGGGPPFTGWVIDRFAGTSPWGLLVMMFLGIIVAFRNIIRISNRRPD